MSATILSGVVVAVSVDLAAGDLPRTHLTLATDSSEVVVTLPGANGPPVVVGGVPTVMVGQQWRLQVEQTPAGLVPVGLGRGMELLSGPVPPPWNLNGLSYSADQLPVTFWMNEEGCEELGADATEAVVTQALEAWTQVGCSSFAFDYAGRTELGFADDGENVLSWENDKWDWGSSVAGLTSTRFDTSTGEVIPIGADIVFNGVDWAWSADGGDIYVSPPTLHAGSVVLHELGHVTGMDHELELVASTMFFAYIGGDWQGSLAGDDRRGLCENYPTGGDECVGDGDCTGLDDQERACVELDGISVCDEVRDEVGDFCSRTVFNCAEYCVFTNNQATEGYCSVGCATDEDCPKGYACDEAGLFLYDDPAVAEELLCVLDSAGDGGSSDGGSSDGGSSDGGSSDGGSSDGGSSDGGASDTGSDGGAAGCGCSGGAPAGLLFVVVVPLALRRRSTSAIVRGSPRRRP